MKISQTIAVLLLFAVYPLAAMAVPPGYVIYWGYVAPSAPFPSTGAVTINGQLLTNAVAISAGRSYVLALRKDATVVGWGFNRDGQATGTASASGDEVTNGLVRVDGQTLNKVTAIAAGVDFGLALRKDGTIAAWGNNNMGQLAVPVGLSNATAIAAGDLNCLALKSDGTIAGWGGANVPQALSNMAAIAVGGTPGGFGGPGGVGVALRNNGTVISWDTRDGVANTPAGLSNILAVAASGLHCLAGAKNGTVVGWGPDNFGAIDIPIGLNNVKAIATGSRFSMALSEDGTVTVWGFNPRHALDVPVGLSNFVAIAAGDNFCLAITTNRAVADKFLQKQTR